MLTETGTGTYPVTYVYDDYGQRTMMKTYRAGTGGSADVTEWEYDEATGLLTVKIDHNDLETTYTYTPEGKLETRTWSRPGAGGGAYLTTYGYDADTGERTSVTYTGETVPTPDVTFTFDRLGRPKTVVDVVGTRTFAYNSVLQLDEEAIDGSGGLYSKTITRDYEDSGGVPGRYAGFHVGTEYTAAYGYDGNGRIGSVDGPGLPAPAAYTRVLDESDTYDTRLIDTIRIAPAIHLVETAYAYEANRDLVTEVVNSVDSVDESKYEYAYDPGRRRASVVNWGSAFGHSGEFSLYDYNGYGELVDAARYAGTDTGDTSSPVTGEHFTYDYDTIGNRETYAVDGGTPIEYTPNTLNQYTKTVQGTTDPLETFAYDDDGNMTADGTWEYVWDAETRLAAAYTPFTMSPHLGDRLLQFKYDYMGRRVRKQTYTHDGMMSYTLDSDELFVYDGWNVVLVLDYTDSNATTHKYTWGLDLSGSIHGAGGVGGLLACEEVSGTYAGDYLFFYDANGNVGQVIDAGDFSVAAHYEYDPFGNQIVATGPYADANPFRFSTKYHDAETGLVYYGYRYYSPRLGRWLNRDPDGEHGGRNLYAFTINTTAPDKLKGWHWSRR